MSFIEKMDRLEKRLGDRIDSLIYIIGCSGLLMAVALSMANILSWWIFRRRLGMADEIGMIGLVWASYTGMGLLYRTNGHCTMDFIVKILPEKGQKVIRIITDILILVISVIAVYYSWKLSFKSFNKKLVLSHIPYFYCDIAVTVGYGHMVLVTIVDIIRSVWALIHWDQSEGKGEEIV